MKAIKFLIVIVILFSFVNPCYSKQKTYGNLQCDTLVSVYDGDSFKCNIDSLHSILGESVSIRLYGADTPELRTKNKYEKQLALKAKEHAYNILSNAKNIELRNIRRGKYFRIVAEVYCDGQSLAKSLIDSDLAYEYYGGKKKPWIQ